MRTYDAELFLRNICFDAERLLDSGDARGAFALLQRKLGELEQREKAKYARVRWNRLEKISGGE